MTRNILIPIDGSENSQRAFDFYINELKKEDDLILLLHVQSPPHLPVFSIHEPMTMPVEEWQRQIQEQVSKSQKLMEHYEMLCETVKMAKKTVLESGKPGEAICHAAKKHTANMIVMGSRGLNAVRRTFMGSVSDYVIHHAHIPTLVVPPKES